jgi:multidrug efflux pump subunit AcrA (membrane-fusion protein)
MRIKLSNKQKFIGISILIILIVSGAFAANILNRQKAVEQSTGSQVKEVKVMALSGLTPSNVLHADGTVKAASQVDIVSQANGTVQSLAFKVGDTVKINQALAFLRDDTLSTNFINSSIGYGNAARSIANTQQLADESIRQADLGVTRAKEVLDGAKIGLKAAQDNLTNAKSLQDKVGLDIKSNALIAYNNYLAAIGDALEQTNIILGVDPGTQLPGLLPTLGIKDSASLASTKDSYTSAKSYYAKLLLINPDPNDPAKAINAVIIGLSQTKKVLDGTINALNNTITSSQLPDITLNTEKSAFNGLRSGLIGNQGAAQGTLQSLQNIDLANKREIDGLKSAVTIAQNQVSQAQVGYQNAVAAVSSAKAGSNQQLLLSKSTLDSARGQMNIVATQLADLTVKSPIGGRIISKQVELGDNVRVGQVLGTIAQTKSVKVISNITAEDADRIKLGQIAKINGNISGVINNINPSADPVTKKISVEIVIDNSKNLLTPETLVTVDLPLSNDKALMNQFIVPLASINISQNENYVFLVDGDKAKKAVIDLIEINGEQATIKAKLSGKSLLIVDGNKLLIDGETIKVTN